MLFLFAASFVGLTVSVSAQIVVNSSADSVAGSLRQAIADASSGETITFTNTLSGETIFLTNGQITVGKNLTIDATALEDGIVIDGNASSRIFEFASGTTNLLCGLTLTNAVAIDNGGAIYVQNGADLTINDLVIVDNIASNGGGIYSSGSLCITNSSIVGNSTGPGIDGGYNGGAGGNGGGIYSSGSLCITDSSLLGNSAGTGGGSLTGEYSGQGGSGGGIYASGLLSIDDNSYISENTAGDGVDGGDGGGIYFSGESQSVYNSTISGNHAGQGIDGSRGGNGGDGGGIFNVSSSLVIQASVISGNYAGSGAGATSPENSNGNGGNGGGIFSVESSLSITSSTVSGNRAGNAGDNGGYFNDAGDGGDGGGIFTSEGSLVINASIIYANGAGHGRRGYHYWGGVGGSGGGIFSAGSSPVIKNSSISRNFTGSGGSGYRSPGGNGGDGGGICNVNDPIIIQNSTIALNYTGNGGSGHVYNITYPGGNGGNGGAIFAGDLLAIESSTISENNTGYGRDGGINGKGDGIYNSSVGINCTNCIVAGNHSQNIFGSILSGTNNLIGGNPHLAPLGDYGGPMQTMPPLLGSPAIDAGGITTLTNDQRGFARVVSGTVDIGAVEFQGNSDIARFWNTDSDGDGNAFGIEYALGTDWTAADSTNTANLAAFQSADKIGVRFGFNPAAADMTAWIVKRSINLTSDPFVEIYRYDGPTDTPTATIPAFVNITGSSFILLDFSFPQPTNAFYRLEAEISP